MTRKSEAVSRVTNGTSLFLAEVDGRTAWPRRFRDLIELHAADLGGGDLLSEAERSLLRRIATHEIELERLEATFAAGEANSEALDLYIRCSGSLKRLLEAVGVDRRQRPVPTLVEYLEHRREADSENKRETL